MDFAIETNGLSKSYGDVHAVNAVNLRVKPGEIYGFLGLNGAGKTTTIRALLGMIRPSAGKVKVLDQPVGPNGSGPWAKVGHLVESPSAYPEVSVRENLEIARRLHSIRDPKVVEEVMQRMGIVSYADRKAGTQSTGNLQRLGLARALLHKPELLILDEPANGLDPAGVVEIRELVRTLAHEEGVTIFMSSHILTEVDRLASRIGIIHKGRMIEELDASKLEQIRGRKLVVKSHNVDNAKKAVIQSGYLSTKVVDHSLVIDETKALEAPEAVAEILVRAGASPSYLAIEQENLEDYFLRLTSEPVSQGLSQ
jgi:ABC-2 type transport system ATP-binding protein